MATALLERAAELAVFGERLEAVRADRRGRMLLVSGEAGIGKTTLVRCFCAGAAPTRVLWGGCDALRTPRALGPLADIAELTGDPLARAVGEGGAPGAVVAALAQELRRAPAIVVLEDLHWADEATLDVLRLLVRRLDALPVLVLATARDDELDHAHPLRVVLGELPAGAVERMAPAPLSPAGVAALAEAHDVDHAELHRRTGGNPFFATEVLAAGGSEIPATVRDAVLARAARLDAGARLVLGAVAVEPSRVEMWLLEALTEGATDGLDACLGSGMLRAERNAVSFRHEIARVTIEESLAPHRRVLLARRALAALAGTTGRRPDLARLAHHAEAADDAGAVLRYAPQAAERASAAGSHREAANQFARAVRYADGLAPARRAELLERRSYECYLTDAIDEAAEARRAALEEHRAAGDVGREGDAHRWLSRLAWFAGDNAAAEEHARVAVELLEPLGPARDLAMAYSNVSQLRMLAGDLDGAVHWGAQAITLAEALGETEVLVHALNNVGTAELHDGVPGGAVKLERSLEIALRDDLEEHVARAYTNLGSCAVHLRRYPAADRHLQEGIAYSRDRDLDSWWLYMTGWRARSELDQGCWEQAQASAAEVLSDPRVAAASRASALVVVGRLRARRGEPDAWAPLDEALRVALDTGELQRLGPVAIARAEAHWLEGDDHAIDEETEGILRLALLRGDVWTAGELAVWRRRAGLTDEIDAAAVAAPCWLELDGEARAAAELWAAIGCPYEAALALADDPDEDAQRSALAELQRLGARPAAARVVRALREAGARDVRRGPRTTTRANPVGLTSRELEVLTLLTEGLRNAEIAARLFIAERTVAHHVSAVLRKLGVTSRGQAGAQAVRLGIVER